ncbi:hypothetical protein EJ05DRAFT_361034 [Pseudovirgaria hyperparasitica]|uniref:Uncharacterized protein n=1 Tax=Pseudovirgaria hyperparasitica TaxID=470096 RepID=A0A6A6W8Z4_9PEZI|nr:uncharacterized protein EJ05DRAFT_361034 [Pseudovirgaria hyperparasitica]KAF2758669.1 hypothetical protein EJ05DRAFT_361034 [Pseudovirgaria hyperparasitica]
MEGCYDRYATPSYSTPAAASVMPQRAQDSLTDPSKDPGGDMSTQRCAIIDNMSLQALCPPSAGRPGSDRLHLPPPAASAAPSIASFSQSFGFTSGYSAQPPVYTAPITVTHQESYSRHQNYGYAGAPPTGLPPHGPRADMSTQGQAFVPESSVQYADFTTGRNSDYSSRSEPSSGYHFSTSNSPLTTSLTAVHNHPLLGTGREYYPVSEAPATYTQVDQEHDMAYKYSRNHSTHPQSRPTL